MFQIYFYIIWKSIYAKIGLFVKIAKLKFLYGPCVTEITKYIWKIRYIWKKCVRYNKQNSINCIILQSKLAKLWYFEFSKLRLFLETSTRTEIFLYCVHAIFFKCILHRTQGECKNWFLKKNQNNYFFAREFLNDEQHLEHFCYWNYTPNISYLGISNCSRLRRDSLYIYV